MATGFSLIKRMTGFDSYLEAQRIELIGFLVSPRRSETSKPASLLLDGEVVVFDKRGVSRFQLLQQGGGEPSYAVFDCLFCEGKDLRGESLATRRTAMENAIGSSRVLLPSQRLATNGLKAFRLAKRRGYEGLVAKDLASHYVEGRSSKWLKVKVHQEDEFVIGGFTKPAGSRKYFGALLLGAYEKGRLRYVGKVGTGFSEKTLAELYKLFQPARSETHCVRGRATREWSLSSCTTPDRPDLISGMDGG